MTVFISCVKKKKNFETTAENLYDSSFFKKQLLYAKKLNPDHIYILSALYGVLELDDMVEPYEKTLNNMNKKDRIDWANMVITQLNKKKIDFEDETVFLCGEKYREFIINYFINVSCPLNGLGIGKQLSYMNEKIKENII